MRWGRSEECGVHPDREHGFLNMTNPTMAGSYTDLGKTDSLTTCSHELLFTCEISVTTLRAILAAESCTFHLNDAIFQEMTTHPTTKLRLATGRIHTFSLGLISPGETISSRSISTSRWGRGNERGKRNGTSRERALTGVHLQNKTAVSCLHQKQRWHTVTMLPRPCLFQCEYTSHTLIYSQVIYWAKVLNIMSFSILWEIYLANSCVIKFGLNEKTFDSWLIKTASSNSNIACHTYPHTQIENDNSDNDTHFLGPTWFLKGQFCQN